MHSIKGRCRVADCTSGVSATGGPLGAPAAPRPSVPPSCPGGTGTATCLDHRSRGTAVSARASPNSSNRARSDDSAARTTNATGGPKFASSKQQQQQPQQQQRQQQQQQQRQPQAWQGARQQTEQQQPERRPPSRGGGFGASGPAQSRAKGNVAQGAADSDDDADADADGDGDAGIANGFRDGRRGGRGGDNDDGGGGVDVRRQRMIREAIEGARRTEGKLAGEAIVRTPPKPGGGGGKVAGKVTFLLSPVEVAREVLDQAERDARELSRRTIHPALVQAQGRRFQSLDPLGLGSGSGFGGAWEGEGEHGHEQQGAKQEQEQEQEQKKGAGGPAGHGAAGRSGGGRGSGKFLHDFRHEDEDVAQGGPAAGAAAAGRRRAPPSPKYRFLVVSMSDGDRSEAPLADAEPDIAPRTAAPPPPPPSPPSPPPLPSTQPQRHQQPHQARTGQQDAATSGPWTQGRAATAPPQPEQRVQRPAAPSPSPQKQQQQQGQQQGQRQRQHQQRQEAQTRRGTPPVAVEEAEDAAEAGRAEGDAEEVEVEEVGLARRQRYDYRLRLDPARSVGGMAGALVQATSRHLVVLSEVMGSDDLYHAVKVVATARTFISQQQQQQQEKHQQEKEKEKGAAGGGGGGNGRRQGPHTTRQQQQRGRQGTTTSRAEEQSPGGDSDLALQVLLPKQPYIRPRTGYGSDRSRRGDSGSHEDDDDDEGERRVWRLYSHRVPAALENGAALVEPPVRLYVSRTSDARELAKQLGPAVVREGRVALMAAGRDAVVTALAAVVRTRSWLASRAGAGSGGEAGGTDAGPGPRPRPPRTEGLLPAPSPAPALPGFVPSLGADLDVALYPTWRGPEGGGEGAGDGGGGEPSSSASLRTLQLVVQLCRGARPDLPVLGADQLVAPPAPAGQ
ncbi:hypothetical protein PLESTB_001865600 [Pleodorina starrii]|uniref:Uncharacterized protein n=1 Tax=Pleodorina starrii TaxID=330485 RepID=A0A9W6FAY2_9CHLO|nr:hypothetical protein PLESTM_001888000 [Pleodorina starrii]GLC62280.1 hypothetical protein PLESTB_001865600 [Pleodorina starrii]GLC70137.1 hypothetical protein PLESTF_000929000 [Pleodorina starrii]